MLHSEMRSFHVKSCGAGATPGGVGAAIFTSCTVAVPSADFGPRNGLVKTPCRTTEPPPGSVGNSRGGAGAGSHAARPATAAAVSGRATSTAALAPAPAPAPAPDAAVSGAVSDVGAAASERCSGCADTAAPIQSPPSACCACIVQPHCDDDDTTVQPSRGSKTTRGTLCEAYVMW